MIIHTTFRAKEFEEAREISVAQHNPENLFDNKSLAFDPLSYKLRPNVPDVHPRSHIVAREEPDSMAMQLVMGLAYPESSHSFIGVGPGDEALWRLGSGKGAEALGVLAVLHQLAFEISDRTGLPFVPAPILCWQQQLAAAKKTVIGYRVVAETPKGTYVSGVISKADANEICRDHRSEEAGASVVPSQWSVHLEDLVTSAMNQKTLTEFSYMMDDVMNMWTSGCVTYPLSGQVHRTSRQYTGSSRTYYEVSPSKFATRSVKQTILVHNNTRQKLIARTDPDVDVGFPTRWDVEPMYNDQRLDFLAWCDQVGATEWCSTWARQATLGTGVTITDDHLEATMGLPLLEFIGQLLGFASAYSGEANYQEFLDHWQSEIRRILP